MLISDLSASSINQAEFAAIDFESAGNMPGQTDVPVQVGIACMGGGLDIREDSFFRSYVAPGRDVTWTASKVHGITTSDLDGAPPLLGLWPEIRTRLRGKVVVAHSAATEKRFLRAFPMHGFKTWIDSLRVARAAYPDAPDHSLGGLVSYLGLESKVGTFCPDLKWHDALYDAVASLVLLRHIVMESHSADRPISLLIQPNLEDYYRLRSASM